MVLWEITLGTAYFLGLKRSYRLALRMQRRLISRKHPRVRGFVQRRTRAVFDVALKVHKNIQQRDIEVGRNVGNWILRWLDRMKPSAQIRTSPPKSSPHPGIMNNANMTKQGTNSSGQNASGSFQRWSSRSDRHMFTSPTNIWSKPFAMMMRPPMPAGSIFQHRHMWTAGPELPGLNHGRERFDGGIRRDILQWMQRN